MLALKNTFGNHTGLEMKEHLREVCKDYKISTKIAYFMAVLAGALSCNKGLGPTSNSAMAQSAEQGEAGQLMGHAGSWQFGHT